MTRMAAHHILVLEDDSALRAVLRDFLSMMNYIVTEAANLESCRALMSQQSFDLLLLDLNLPDGDGLSLLKEITKHSDTPVFVVSGRHDEHTRLQALEAGADDYIIKPFNARELELRMRNFLRRQYARNSGSPTVISQGLQLRSWLLLPDQYRLSGPQGETLTLTRSECDLLKVLLLAEGNLCSRAQLARAIASPMETSSEETVTVLIYRLRKKLENISGHSGVIETVAGAGYRILP